MVSINGAIDTSTLKISNQTVTFSADELNILDGADVNTSDLNAIKGLVNVTAANINQLAGVSTSIATELENRYTETEADNKFSVKEGSSSIVTVGPLSGGSITSNFGDINIGTSVVTAGSLMVSSNIGHTGNPNLISLETNAVAINKPTTINGLTTVGSLNIGGTTLNSQPQILMI